MLNIYRVDHEASAHIVGGCASDGKHASTGTRSTTGGMDGASRPFMPLKCIAII